jgi:hypothetical protein
MRMTLPADKAELQHTIFINDNAICIPLFSKEGLGEIFQKKLFVKSPSIPLFQRGRLRRRIFHNFITFNKKEGSCLYRKN